VETPHYSLTDTPLEVDLRALQRVGKERFTLLWWEHFYDGPLYGMALLDGQKHWYRCYESNGASSGADSMERHIVFFRLDPEHRRLEEEWHELFRKYVTGVTDFVRERPHRGLPRRTPEEMETFARLWAAAGVKARQLAPNSAVGFYEDPQNRLVDGPRETF
jgi:hypothetical protein